MPSRSRRFTSGFAAMVAALSVALLVAVVPLAPPSRAAPAQVFPLGADNLVRAERSGAMLVEIARPASFALSPDGDADLKIEGRGRIIAFTLQRAGSANPSDAVRVVRYNGCFSTACEPDEPKTSISAGFGTTFSADGSRATLRPGPYKLVVLADGAPVTARLRLAGLSGSRTLIPPDKSESGFVEVRSTSFAPAAASQMSWSGGGDVRLSSANSLLLGFLEQDAGVSAGAVVYSCYFGAGARPLNGHYLPACPGEGGDVVFNTLFGAFGIHPFVSSGGRLRVLEEFPSSRGDQAAGFHLARPGVNAEPRGYLAFLRLD